MTSRRADHRRDGHDAAAERLAQQHQVGPHALVVAGEGRAGAAEARLDLVGDQQHAVRGRRARAPPAGSRPAG